MKNFRKQIFSELGLLVTGKSRYVKIAIMLLLIFLFSSCTESNISDKSKILKLMNNDISMVCTFETKEGYNEPITKGTLFFKNKDTVKIIFEKNNSPYIETLLLNGKMYRWLTGAESGEYYKEESSTVENMISEISNLSCIQKNISKDVFTIPSDTVFKNILTS